MTIPKKGSRVITVGERSYRYIVKALKPEDRGLMVTVQEDTPNAGRVMQFGWPSGHAVEPRDVRDFILSSLDKGWDPLAKGAAFDGGKKVDLGDD